MLNQVTLKADGSIQASDERIVANPMQYLGHQLHLAATCTLRSYFRMIDAYPPFAELGDFFGALKAQYAQCPDQDCQWPEYEYLEFAKTVEMIGHPGDPRLEIYNSLQGVKGQEAFEIRALPLQALLDMPVQLGKLKHVVFGDGMDTFEFDTVYTLFEFIDSIAWELSFHGVPPECKLRS